MTSNIGSHLIVEGMVGQAVGRSGGRGGEWEAIEERVRAELRNHFRPEFLNRVDDIVVFRPLSREDLDRIVDLQIARLDQLLAERQLVLRLTPEARQLLAERGYDPIYGARPLKRVIQRMLQNPLAMAVLEGSYGPGDTIIAEREGDQLHFVREGGGVPAGSSRGG